jgi:hypothetical protein
MALVALSIGYFVYALARPHTQSFLLWHVEPASLPHLHPHAYWLGPMPSFLHTYAFAILLALAVGSDRRNRLVALLTWCAIEIAAEFAQLPVSGHWLDAHVGAASQLTWVRAFLGGTFSVADIAAVLTGTALAALSVGINNNQKVDSHEIRVTWSIAGIAGRRRARGRSL